MGRLCVGQGKVEKECLECHEKFMARHDRPGLFCGRSCAGKYKIQPNFQVELECEVCSEKYKVKRYREKTSKTCTHDCHMIYIHRLNSGESHHNWKGGYSERGSASRVLIARLKKQKGCCEECGCRENLQGHHVIPWSQSVELRYSAENILILCIDCHSLKHPEWANFIISKRAA